MANVRKHWFLIAIGLMLVVGAIGYESLGLIADRIPRSWLVATILLLMSCPIDLARSLATKSAIGAAAIGVVVNCLFAGPLALLAGQLLSEPLAAGLIIATLSPCTMASAAVWTRMGRGNEAVAIAITVVTTLLTFIVLPVGFSLLIGQTESVSGTALAQRLFLIVVLPVGFGQLLRKVSPLKTKFDTHRKRFSFVAQLGLLGMVFIASVRNGAILADPTTRLSLSEWAILIGVASAVHLALFYLAWRLARGFAINKADALAAGVGGSQKTLAVGLDVSIGLGGVAILPMLVYHASQLMIDTVLVHRLGPSEETKCRKECESYE